MKICLHYFRTEKKKMIRFRVPCSVFHRNLILSHKMNSSGLVWSRFSTLSFVFPFRYFFFLLKIRIFLVLIWKFDRNSYFLQQHHPLFFWSFEWNGPNIEHRAFQHKTQKLFNHYPNHSNKNWCDYCIILPVELFFNE